MHPVCEWGSALTQYCLRPATHEIVIHHIQRAGVLWHSLPHSWPVYACDEHHRPFMDRYADHSPDDRRI